MLTGKNIVLGVAGGIAAYKVVEVASRLKKAGAAVYVIMTHAATQFITPLTFREITVILWLSICGKSPRSLMLSILPWLLWPISF